MPPSPQQPQLSCQNRSPLLTKIFIAIARFSLATRGLNILSNLSEESGEWQFGNHEDQQTFDNDGSHKVKQFLGGSDAAS
jgi:hypothetical protein